MTTLDELHDEETRVTAETGGQKGKKLTQLGAVDPLALIELGRVAGMGANKYRAFNFLRGYEWSLSFNAMMRHALLFWSGEDRDAESGLPHMAHAAWMALSLVSFMERGLGTDDRPPSLGRISATGFVAPPSPRPAKEEPNLERPSAGERDLLSGWALALLRGEAVLSSSRTPTNAAPLPKLSPSFSEQGRVSMAADADIRGVR